MDFKVVIYVFIFTVDEITMCNMKEVGHSDEPTDSVPQALQSTSASFSLLVPQLHCFGKL